MNVEILLKEKFPDILEAFLEKEGTLNFLRIKVNFRELKDIEKISKEISAFLDETDPIKEEYYLDIFSKGIEEDFSLENIDNFLNENIQVWLNKDYFILGQLLEHDLEKITLKVNKKGQIKKENINKNDIYKLNTFVKFK